MSNAKKIEVDADKFRELMGNIGKTPASAAREMGRGDVYLNRKLRQGYFEKQDVVTIEALFGIKADDYIKKPETVQKSEETTTSEIDYKKLGKVIFDSVYAAMISADKAIRESR